ncbi:flagellar hook-basal body complex protein [Clostridium sp. C2-6-12]|uniref:flagellar hook-basal body complex protein n=1 Tax=Clostridium sp. C2-6-12 TaxID=2698832 RepID=UPI001369A3F1|nr:flagellar hook-basal body complex protein [Clostridium sp. C2-6-12]
MLRCMYSGISGMRANQTKLDVIGNNIANVSTTSFKASSARFKDMLYQNAGEATAPTSAKGGTNAKQVGLGAQLSSINKVMGQGNALSTGRSLDVCVDGDGYFMVGKGIADYTTGKGTTLTADHKIAGGDMEILYTRDGNLTLDKEGNLLTADGYRVMGYLVKGDADEDDSTVKSAATSIDETGEALFVNADGMGKTSKKSALRVTGDVLQPLKIPDYVKKEVAVSGKIKDATKDTKTTQPVKKFEIGSDGLITAVLGDGSRTVLGQIAMASFKNPEGLVSVGGNYLNVSSNSGEPIVRSGVNVQMKTDGTLDTAIDDNSKGYGDCIQGCLEGSNVDLTEQFTDMITATRSFQAASKMITTGDEILQTITGLMR